MLVALLEFVQRHLPALAGLFSLSTLALVARFVFNLFIRATSRKIEVHLARPPLNVPEIYEARNRSVPYVGRHGCSAECLLRRHMILKSWRASLVPRAFMLLQREGKVVFHAGLYYLKGTEPQGAN